MNKYLCALLACAILLLAARAYAQSTEQDRRIEEQKREALKPTINDSATAGEVAAEEKDAALQAPLPMKEIYMASLIRRRIAFNYDLAKSVVILMEVDEKYIDLDSQVEYMKKSGFLPGRLRNTFNPMAPLRKGVAAYILYRALEIPGGVMLHLFGPSERYALKELAHQGIMSPGLCRDLVGGQELIQIVAKSAEYKTKRENL